MRFDFETILKLFNLATIPNLLIFTWIGLVKHGALDCQYSNLLEQIKNN